MPLDPEPPDPDWADPGTRLTAGALAAFAVGIGLFFAVRPPPECWWLARVFGTFLVALGCYVLVVAVRGRRADLQGVSPREVGADAVGGCLARLVVMLFVGLVVCVVGWIR